MFGRPNITGGYAPTALAYGNTATVAGALFSEPNSTNPTTAANTSTNGNQVLRLNANLANSLYSGSLLQLPAVQTLMIIKVWIAGIWKLVPEYKAFDLLALNEMLDAPSPSTRVILRACRAFQYREPLSITSLDAEYDWDRAPVMFGGPNIMGNTNIVGYCAPDVAVGDGAFTLSDRWVQSFQLISGATNAAAIRFRASDSDSLYSGSTLQPSSVQTLMIIRTWTAGVWTVAPSWYICEYNDALKRKRCCFITEVPMGEPAKLSIEKAPVAVSNAW